MHTILPAILALLVFSSPSPEQGAPARGPARAPAGRLLAVGGGGTTDAIVQQALALAGGAEARVLIVPQASSREDAGDSSAVFWKERGARNVTVLDVGDRAAAQRAIAAADFIWMPGGDQNRLAAALREADLVEALRARHKAGALVGGTSAGAAVLSAAMIAGGERADLETVRAGGTELVEGLGLWPDVLVDQHFLARRRFNRLLAGVLDRPELVGIGVDERTGVILHPDGVCEVVGDGAVLVLDARRAKRQAAEKGAHHSASGVSLAVYRAGDRFTLAQEEKR